MTTTSNPYGELISRLNAVRSEAPKHRPTIAELEAILATPNPQPVMILPSGEITVGDALVNPDGPEAADALSRLTRDVEGFREQTLLVDRLCSAVDQAAEDIGHESIDDLLRQLGPMNERCIEQLGGRATLTRLSAPKEVGADPALAVPAKPSSGLGASRCDPGESK